MNVYDLTYGYIKESDENAWNALQIVIGDNPDYIQKRLVSLGYGDAPLGPENLFQYVYDKLMNGSMNPADFQAALNGAPITTPSSFGKSSGDFWSDLGMVGGAALSALFPPPNAPPKPNTNAATTPAAASDMTVIYLVIGAIVVIGVVLLIVKKK